jgi:hypothetical protein
MRLVLSWLPHSQKYSDTEYIRRVRGTTISGPEEVRRFKGIICYPLNRNTRSN